jgi:hypothetical protein
MRNVYFAERAGVMMIKRFLGWLALAIASTMIIGCSHRHDSSTERELLQNICTAEWYNLVERQLSTGDGQGHGPDLGSLEWRSVVEFKLGLRGDARVPALETDLWCAYINEHFVATKIR